MSLLLALLYPLAIQYQRGGYWRIMTPLAFVTALIDVAANYTELALLTWDFPRRGEHTFSQRLGRLQHNTDWRGSIARPIVSYLNWVMPGHVK